MKIGIFYALVASTTLAKTMRNENGFVHLTVTGECSQSDPTTCSSGETCVKWTVINAGLGISEEFEDMVAGDVSFDCEDAISTAFVQQNNCQDMTNFQLEQFSYENGMREDYYNDISPEDVPGIEKLNEDSADFQTWFDLVSKYDEEVADWKNVVV